MEKPIKLLNKIKLNLKSPASIAYSDDGIWVADVETSILYLVDPSSGTIKKRLDSGVRRPQTISWDGEFLWIYDELTLKLMKRKLSDNSFYFYGAVPGVNLPYLGMAYNSKERTLYLISPDQPEFTVTNNKISLIKFPRQIRADTYDAPTYSCRGLCFCDNYLWTLDVENREIFALDPDSGTILTSYNLYECKIPSSIVITKDRFYTIDLKSNELLTFEINKEILFYREKRRISKVDVVYNVVNQGPGTILDLELHQSIPFDYKNQKILTPVKIIPEADETIPCQWDEREEGIVAFNHIKNLPAGESRDVTMSIEVETYDVKYFLYPHKCKTLDDIPEEIKKRYLLEELAKHPDYEISEIVKIAQILFETHAKEIRQKVEEIVDGEKNPFWIAKKLYDFVVDKVEYVLPYSSLSSRKILSQGKGSCGNHATIYIALCQVAGLPTRSIIGFAIWKDDSRLGYLDHEIPEVYLPTYGFVPVDTSRFMSLPIYSTSPIMKFRSFGTLSNRFFVNGFGRDMTSSFAKRKYREEKLPLCDKDTKVKTNFFMRWVSNEFLDV